MTRSFEHSTHVLGSDFVSVFPSSFECETPCGLSHVQLHFSFISNGRFSAEGLASSSRISALGKLASEREDLWAFTRDFVQRAFLPAYSSLSTLSGQEVSFRVSRKIVARWHLQKGEITGLSVTLRRSSIYAFLDRYINVVWPRIQPSGYLDYSFVDTAHNLSFGLDTLLVFPEIEREYSNYQILFNGRKVTLNTKFLPLEVSLVTTQSCNSREKVMSLFSSLSIPVDEKLSLV